MTMHDDDVNAWVIELRFLRRSPKTIKARRLQVEAWRRWLGLRGLTPATARRADVIAFLLRFDNPETAASYRSALRGYHQWLVDSGRTVDDPTRRLPPIRRDRGDPRPIPDELLSEVLATVGPRDRAMILLGRFAGLRAGEIARAHRDYLRHGLAGPVVRLQGKGGRWRELPAHPLVVGVLVEASGWVFESPRYPGQPLQPDWVSLRLGRLLPDPWTAHSLRHAFATQAYARTRDLRLVQEWLGHGSPATTAIYVGVRHDHAAIEGMRLELGRAA